MSMHKTLSVKSRVRGDFHARFCERVRVKFPRSTRSWPSDVFQHDIRVLCWQKRVGKFRKISSFSLCGAFFIPILQISPNKSLLLQSQLLAESPNGWNAGIDTYIHKGVSCALVLTICELRNFNGKSKNKATGTSHGCIIYSPHWLLVFHSYSRDANSWYSILYTYVGLSASLVSTYRAMRRPSECGTSDRTCSTFFVSVW